MSQCYDIGGLWGTKPGPFFTFCRSAGHKTVEREVGTLKENASMLDQIVKLDLPAKLAKLDKDLAKSNTIIDKELTDQREQLASNATKVPTSRP